MLSQDEAGKVVYASSFSKTVCPGIRVGYLVGPQAVIKQIQGIATNTYISPNMVAQSIVNEFCRSGPDRRARSRRSRTRCARAATRSSPRSSASCRRRASRRRRAATSCGSSCRRASTSPSSRRAAKERGVVFVKGTDFLLEGGENTLRLAYSGVTPEQIDEGVTRLAEAARSLGVAA